MQNPLGVQLRDENQTEQMVDIMTESQRYVPMSERKETVDIPSIDQTVEVVTAVDLPLLFAGDQKTAVRARGAKKAKLHAVSPFRRLAGFIAC